MYVRMYCIRKYVAAAQTRERTHPNRQTERKIRKKRRPRHILVALSLSVTTGPPATKFAGLSQSKAGVDSFDDRAWATKAGFLPPFHGPFDPVIGSNAHRFCRAKV
jgi:hypothetical protein